MVVCDGIAKWIRMRIGLALLGFRRNEVTTLTFVVKWSVDQGNLSSLVQLVTPSSGWRVRCVKLADFLPLLVWRILRFYFRTFLGPYTDFLWGGGIRTVFVQFVRVFHIVKYNYVGKLLPVHPRVLENKTCLQKPPPPPPPPLGIRKQGKFGLN